MTLTTSFWSVAAAALLLQLGSAQTFQRLGTCPTLGMSLGLHSSGFVSANQPVRMYFPAGPVRLVWPLHLKYADIALKSGFPCRAIL